MYVSRMLKLINLCSYIISHLRSRKQILVAIISNRLTVDSSDQQYTRRTAQFVQKLQLHLRLQLFYFYLFCSTLASSCLFGWTFARCEGEL